MTGTSLTKQELTACKKMVLNTSPKELRRFVIEQHQKIRHSETLRKREEIKNKKREDKLNKRFKKSFEKLGKEKVKAKGKHADTTTLRKILSILTTEVMNTKQVSKLSGCAKHITKDGCDFLKDMGIIKSSSIGRFHI